MAIQLGSAYGKVELDASGVRRGVDTGITSLKKLEGMAAPISAAMQKIGAAMTLAVTVPLTLIGKKSLEYAAGLQQSKDNVNRVFGEMSDSVLKWSQTSARAFGQSQEEALDAANSFGLLFESWNIGKQQAAEMSMKLTALASDLAVLNKESASDAQQKLKSALEGNGNALKEYGINLSDAQIKAKAFQMGLVSASVDMVKVNGATLDLKEAQRDLAEIQNGGADSADRLAKAQSRIADANDRNSEASKKVQRAQEDLNKLMASGEASERQLESAKRRLEDAQDDASIAGRKYADVMRDVNGLTQKSVPDNLELAQAKQKVAEAERRLNDAMGGNIAALDEATKAQVMYQLILEQTAETQGMFSESSQNLAVQMMILQAEVKNAMTQIGNILLPIALKIVLALNDILEAFQTLPPGLQRAIVYFGIFLALAGPLTGFIGTMIQLKLYIGEVALTLKALGITLPTLSGMFMSLGTAISSLATWITSVAIPAIVSFGTAFWAALLPLLPIIALIAASVLLVYLLWKNWDQLKITTSQLGFIIKHELKKALDEAGKAAINFKDEWGRSLETWKGNFQQAQEINQKVQQLAIEAMIKTIMDFVMRASLKLTELRNWAINTWNSIASAFTTAWSTISNFFESVKNSILAGIQAIKDAVNDLIASLASIVLPADLTPGSPTPFEMGLRGVASAMSQLSQQSIPELNRSFAMAQAARSPAYAMANAGGGNVVSQTLNFADGLTERRAARMMNNRIESAFEQMSRMLEDV